LSPVTPRLLSVDRLLLHGGCGPHTRRTGADAAKQRTVAYLSGRGRGNRCFCHRELITIVTPLNRPSSAKTAASVCLYSVYIKQERSLFTAALEQTSNVPTATSTDCPAVSDGGGEAVIPRPIVRGSMAAALPRSRSHVPSPGRFGRTTASYVDRPQAPMEFCQRPGTAPGPAGDTPFAPPPAILRSRR